MSNDIQVIRDALASALLWPVVANRLTLHWLFREKVTLSSHNHRHHHRRINPDAIFQVIPVTHRRSLGHPWTFAVSPRSFENRAAYYK